MIPAPWSTRPSYHHTHASDGRCGPRNHFLCPKKQCCGPHGKCGKEKERCGKGCQLNYGDCWKSDTNKQCRRPHKHHKHPVASIIGWGGGGLGLAFPPIRFPHLCPEILRAFHLCKPKGGCGSGGCDGSDGGGWCISDCGGDDIGASGGGEECYMDLTEVWHCFDCISDDVSEWLTVCSVQCEPPHFEFSSSQSSSEKCSTTYRATDKTKYCTPSTTLHHGTTHHILPKGCISTKAKTRKACTPIDGSTKTIWGHCKTETAIEFTYSCTMTNKTISMDGHIMTIKPSVTCTKTVSSVVSGCRVHATTTVLLPKGLHVGSMRRYILVACLTYCKYPLTFLVCYRYLLKTTKVKRESRTQIVVLSLPSRHSAIKARYASPHSRLLTWSATDTALVRMAYWRSHRRVRRRT